MSKSASSSKKTKIDLVCDAFLSRMTDFQIQSHDDELLNDVEDLRQLIVKFAERKNLDRKSRKKCKNQLRMF